MEIKIYTDGACVGNPGPGGWAAIVLLENEKKELFGGERLTTNNRMELMAAIKSLEYCAKQEEKQPSLKHIKIFTDSTYVKEGITVWINSWEKNNWKKIYNSIKKDCLKIQPNLPKVIEKNLDEIEKNWPKNIPSGIIHADLFSDNIFFKDDKLSGIIDYYFSCSDFYAFEIAICLNALCFEGHKENLSFNVTKAKKFIDGYSQVRQLSEEEKKSLKILCQGAAMRFLLTRVFDYLNLTEGAIVKIKDPVEYLKRLEFHNNVKNYQDYFF